MSNIGPDFYTSDGRVKPADTIRDELAAVICQGDSFDLHTEAMKNQHRDVADAVLSSSVVARIRAEAWDEGALAGLQLWHGDEPMCEHRPYWWKPVNPYRKATDA